VIPKKPITDAPIWRGPPRDAATLIVVECGPPDIRILLGRRGDRHVFMPGKFVFPGGRVDPGDLRLARALLEDHPVVERLQVGTGRRFGRDRAMAVALAGLRETFEEAGLMIGRASAEGALRSGGSAWSAFAEAGIVPNVAALVPVARAITPPGHVRRYDTRFFCVGAEAIARQVPFEERCDPELDSLGWFTVEEALALDLPRITRQVLGDVAGRLRDGSWRDVAGPMPFYRVRHQRHVRDMI
jgi:8-oxo-dGTP pyrophosphatase MutT (NUDIX family)